MYTFGCESPFGHDEGLAGFGAVETGKSPGPARHRATHREKVEKL